MTTTTDERTTETSGQIAPVVRVRDARTLLEDDIFHADFPTSLDKYDLRSWLIGRSVMRGWDWTFDDYTRLEGTLEKNRVVVDVVLVSCGLRMVCGTRIKLVETSL